MNIQDNSTGIIEVHARSIAEHEGLGRGGARRRWIEPGKKGVRFPALGALPQLRPVVRGRLVSQHLLQRAQRHVANGRAGQVGADPRFAAGGTVTKLTYAQMAGPRSKRSPLRDGRFGRRQGRRTPPGILYMPWFRRAMIRELLACERHTARFAQRGVGQARREGTCDPIEDAKHKN